jgi:hypothetical protein
VVDGVTEYRVVVRRDPEDTRFWLADVDGLDGAHTYSRSLATLDRYVREAIVLAADLDDDAEDDLHLDWQYLTGDPDLDRAAERIRARRAELDTANRELAEQTGSLARLLVTQHGLSVRETAALLAISAARVDQLVQQPKKRPGRAA